METTTKGLDQPTRQTDIMQPVSTDELAQVDGGIFAILTSGLAFVAGAVTVGGLAWAIKRVAK